MLTIAVFATLSLCIISMLCVGMSFISLSYWMITNS